MEGYICIDIEKTTYSKHLLTEIFKLIQLAHMDKIWKKAKQSDCIGKKELLRPAVK